MGPAAPAAPAGPEGPVGPVGPEVVNCVTDPSAPVITNLPA